MEEKNLKPSGLAYAGLVIGQTVAAMALFWIVFPLFHQIITHLGEQQELRLSQQIAIICSAALLHACYWTRLNLVPVVAPFHNVFVAHVCSFASRVSFFFGGALFSALFFRHVPELDALPSFERIALGAFEILLVLFALFCYSQELERLAKAIEEPRDPTAPRE
ncbi:hypothetical protein [Pararhizobium qamdonense]|uniref:hypothetical protein n=1 Tax=Pararhizobium qamdonense TaxID=3031126 RepID=UPI0023E1CF25|nr:hypothetical protein [Pararhizobium qamdonense]